MTQAVLIDEMLLKHIIIRDQVITQRVEAEGRLNMCTDVIIVNMSSQVMISDPQH
jgi:hypothetical protein